MVQWLSRTGLKPRVDSRWWRFCSNDAKSSKFDYFRRLKSNQEPPNKPTLILFAAEIFSLAYSCDSVNGATAFIAGLLLNLSSM